MNWPERRPARAGPKPVHGRALAAARTIPLRAWFRREVTELWYGLSTHEIKVTVSNEHGLHARPVTEFVQLANKFQSKVEVVKDDVSVDGKSVASMLTLGAGPGTVLRVRAEGVDAAQAVKKLVALITSRFGEQ
jgi:phosphocarrier protein HPr